MISPSIPMQVVGIDAKELMASDGTKLHYTTNSVTMGGGMSADVILDTSGVAAGEYYLYASNLHYLANNDEAADLGGMMTKIVITSRVRRNDMNRISKSFRASGALAMVVAATLVWLPAGSAEAQARIDGITGVTSFSFEAGAGEVSTPDGGSIHFWGYQDLDAHEGVGLPQYPGPTLILNQGDIVTITLTSNLPFGQCTSIVFPGHAVTATGGDQTAF